jgi:hypothetical protein
VGEEVKTISKWQTDGQSSWVWRIEYCCSELSVDHQLAGDSLVDYDKVRYCPFCGHEFQEGMKE